MPEAMMRQKTCLLYAGVAVLMAAMSACAGSKDTATDDAAAAPVSAAPVAPDQPTTMRPEFAEPRPDHVLQIAVKSATRTGDRIELVLNGTYGGNRTTQWDMTSVEAGTDTSACQVSADPGFPRGASLPRSVVTGTWALTCPGGGPVRLTVDPFGGLLDSDSSFRITLS
ncbi:hypothetical protein JIG36_27855 [Actinoplanes sp. LDG1-06]|uniref:Uncharacterized protein n=1 Tax=Paractinoplanes ovalisporus TaxID=2810368 RepID=A0ABS2AJ27_9ACTN|nr:hypothetical protein [Actinoplanes ovalisporus]MBM2619373.1 hypothetical protein [Actinoplanes ovalisporus]